MGEYKYRDGDLLSSLYWGDGLTLDEIADRLDTTKSTIGEWMEKNDIPRRSPKEAALLDEQPYRDKDTLQELYWEEKLSLYQIADRFGTDATQIRDWMERHDIPRRTPTEGVRQRYSAAATVRFTERGRGKVYVSDIGELRCIPLAKMVALLDHPPEEVFSNDVHHKNGCPSDDRLDNLELLSHADHAKHHYDPANLGN